MLNFRAPAFLSLAALSLAQIAPLAPPAFAQAPPPMMHGPHPGGPMADPLGLTDAQKARMRPVFMTDRRQYRAIQVNTSLPPEAKMAKMKALRKSTRQQTMTILTPDQRAKLKSLRQANRQAKAGIAEDN